MTNIFSRIQNVDKRVSGYFADSKDSWLKKTLSVMTHLGAGASWIAVYTLTSIFMYDRFSQLLHTLISAEMIGLCFIISLRYLAKRARPDKKYQSIIAWNRYSFPSHHSLRVFFIATVGGAYFPHLLSILLIAAVVISFSRIVLLRHYLSDVVTGGLLGVLTANLSLRLFLFVS